MASIDKSVEKRAKSELRKLAFAPECLVLVNTGTQAYIVAQLLLKKIFSHLEVPEIEYEEYISLISGTLLRGSELRSDLPADPCFLVPLSRDEVNVGLLTTFFSGVDGDSGVSGGARESGRELVFGFNISFFTQNYFLRTIAFSDLQSYAREHNLSLIDLRLSDSDVRAQKFISQLSLEQPQTPFSLQKTFENLRDRLLKK